MASFSSGMPSTVVYLVLPSRMALIAASLMFSGVSKSGSPAASEMMSRPAAFSSRPFWSAARVADGFTRDRAADSSDMAGQGSVGVRGGRNRVALTQAAFRVNPPAVKLDPHDRIG